MPRNVRPLPEIDQQEEAIVIDGFRLLPLADMSVAGGAAEFHPKALAGIAWDSNPLSVEDGAEGDVRTRLALGAELRAFSSGGWRADLDGTLIVQRYGDTPARDDTGGNARARTQYRGPTASFHAEAGWDLGREPIAELPEQVRRERLDASVQAGSESGASRWSGRLAFNTLDYREDSSYFTRDQRDYHQWSAAGSWHALGGGDSLLGIEGMAETTLRDATATANPWKGATVAGRWRHAMGRRSFLDCRLGATVRRFDDTTDADPANDDQSLVAPVGTIRLGLPWENGSYLMLSASSGLAEGLTGSTNASERQALEANGRVRLADRFAAVGGAWFVHRTDSAPTQPSGRTESTDDLYLRIGLEYRLRDGLGLRLWSSWQRRDAAVGLDYDRALLAAELAAAL